MLRYCYLFDSEEYDYKTVRKLDADADKYTAYLF